MTVALVAVAISLGANVATYLANRHRSDDNRAFSIKICSAGNMTSIRLREYFDFLKTITTQNPTLTKAEKDRRRGFYERSKKFFPLIKC